MNIIDFARLFFRSWHEPTARATARHQMLGLPFRRRDAFGPEGVTWTAFFKTPAGGFGSVWRFPNESTCQNYIGALRSDVPSACRQLAHPEPCPVACKLPETPAAKPVEPDPTPAPPDPASIAPSDIQVGGKQYTKVAGLTWVESGQSTYLSQSSAFADVSVGPTELQSKDKPSLPKTAEKEAGRTALLRPRTPAPAGVHRYGDVAV